MNTEDRNSRKIIAGAKEGETTILFVVVAVMAAILLTFALLVLPAPTADAATKKVTVRYDVPGSQWNVKAAVKDSGLRIKKVKRVKPSVVADCGKRCVVVFDVADRFEHDCAGFPKDLRSTAVLVCKTGRGSATVMLSAPVAKTLTAAQRQAALTSALRSLR